MEPVAQTELAILRRRVAELEQQLRREPVRDHASASGGAVHGFTRPESLQAREARHAFLLRLNDRLRPLADPVEIQYEAACTLGEYLGASRVGYAEDQQDGETLVVTRNYTDGVPGIEGRYRYEDYGAALLSQLRAGRTVVHSDVANDSTLSDAEKRAHAALQLGAIVDVPLIKAGRLVAVLFMHHREARHWTADELALLEDVAARTWEAVERARAEEALSTSEREVRRHRAEQLKQLQTFDTVLAKLQEFVYLFDREGRFRYVNKPLLDLWGLTLEQAVGKNFAELGYPDELVRLHEEQIRRVVETGQPVDGENAYTSPAGVTGYYEYTFVPLLAPDGSVEAVGGHTRDVTERRRAEAAMRGSETKYRTLFECIDEGFCIIQVLFDADGNAYDYRFVEANPAFEKQSGLTGTIGRTIREFVPNHDEHWFRLYGEVARTGTPARLQDYAAAMGRWFDVYTFRVGAPENHHVAVLFSDITERKRREVNQAFLAQVSADFARLSSAEEILQTVGAKIGAFLNITSCSLADVDEAGGVLVVHDSWGRGDVPSVRRTFRTADYLSEEFLRASRAGETVVVRDTQTDPLADARNYATLEIGAFVTVPFHRDGKWRHFLAVTDSQARDWRTDEIELIQDLANRLFPRLERARAEQALRESEEQLQRVFQQAPVAIVVFRGRDFVVELANPSYQALLPGRELVGRRFAEAAPELEQEVWDVFHRVLDTGEPFIANEWHIPYDADRDGVVEDHWFNVVYHPFREPSGTVSGFIAVLTDVTVQVRARQETERINRELEEFAYVSSHDLQEPLRMVNIYTQLILRRLGREDATINGYAEFVQQGVTRMQTLLRDLLGYSRAVQKEETPAGVADLSASLQEAMSVLQSRIEDSKAVVHAEPLPYVRGDAQQLAHVFQNLLSNALKYRKPDVTPEIVITAEQQSEQWVISVRDNGIGFEQKYAEKIFGLFKRLHKDAYPGTGLGLAICKRIVERYGGRMWAEGRPGVGATFSFALSPANPRQ